MSRIFYRGQLRYLGCYFYRCLLPLQQLGYQGDLLTIRSVPNPAEISKGIMDAEIVVMHRPFEKASKDLFLALREGGKKLVIDGDDTYNVEKSEDIMKLGSMASAMSNSINWFLREADLVTCTNEFLADEYRKLNKNVVVLPNYINPEDFPKVQRNKTKKVRIGIIGSVGLNNTNDVENIKDIIKELSERKDVTLVLFGQSPDVGFWKDIKLEYHTFVHMADYYQKLSDLKLDMAIIPRRDTYFNRAKSNVKFLECSMLEIPCICQSWGDGKSPYDPDKDYVLLANKPKEWKHEIDELIKDKELRKMMGTRAKKYVVANYSIIKNAYRWKDEYNKLLE